MWVCEETKDDRVMRHKMYHLVGYASGIAGPDQRVGEGPVVIKKSPFLHELNQRVALNWAATLTTPPEPTVSTDIIIANACTSLAKITSELTTKREQFCVLGGDHASAIGTWSGVYDAVHQSGDIGLIWIDAHMDSHTPQTSESGNIHGMPLACLLGQGYSSLTSILNTAPKIKPQHLCLIGVRSFEGGEAAFLKNMNVKVYFMEEVKQRGFEAILKEAVDYVSRGTIGYGITLDIDAIDPLEAPGVDVPEADGIKVKELKRGLQSVAADNRLLATEIVEFDPSHDKEQMTEKLIISFIEILASAK